MIVLDLVVSGGQTGADQAGWRAAKAAGIRTGGYMPPRFATEDGNRIEFSGCYGAKALDVPAYSDDGHSIDWKSAYRDRTRLNVEMSDATLWFGHISPGYWATRKPANERMKPIWEVMDDPRRDITVPEPRLVANAIRLKKIVTLNVAGNRESSWPGIGEWVERYMTEVFRVLKEQQ